MSYTIKFGVRWSQSDSAAAAAPAAVSRPMLGVASVNMQSNAAVMIPVLYSFCAVK